jgi:integrase
VGVLGSLRLDQITPAVLRGWWGEEIEAHGRSVATGRRYLVVLQGVYRFAIELGLVDSTPVPAMLEVVRRLDRSKRGRAASDPAQRIRPIESPEDIARLVDAARADGVPSLALVLLCLDGGLRLGEALGLRWGCVVWGADDADTSRRLELDARSNRPRGVGEGTTPKSGRTRSVAMSRRLRSALRELRMARGRPGSERLVLEGIDASNWRKRSWRRLCEQSQIGDRDIKDLRDTFASQLLTAGVHVAYVSQQLGHATWAVTAGHYARWVPKSYVEPMRLAPGEVPPDLLARLVIPSQDNVSEDVSHASATGMKEESPPR